MERIYYCFDCDAASDSTCKDCGGEADELCPRCEQIFENCNCEPFTVG